MNSLYSPDSPTGRVALGIVMNADAISFVGTLMFGTLFEYIGQLICFLTLLVPFTSILLFSVVFSICSNNTENECSSEQVTIEGLGLASFYDIVKIPIMLTGCVSLALAWLPRICIENTISVWMLDEFSSGPTTVGDVLSLSAISVLSANLLSVALTVRYPEKTVVFTCLTMCFTGLSAAALSLSYTPYHIAVIFAIHIFFSSCNRYFVMNIMSTFAETLMNIPRCQVMSVANIGMLIPYMTAPCLAIPLYNSIGFRYMCLTVGPLCTLYAPFIYLIIARTISKSEYTELEAPG